MYCHVPYCSYCIAIQWRLSRTTEFGGEGGLSLELVFGTVPGAGAWRIHPTKIHPVAISTSDHHPLLVTPSVLHPKSFTKTCHENHVYVLMHVIKCVG